MSHPAVGGAVYDRGYRPYDGIRGERREAMLALYRNSLRRALGLRRPWRQKVMPFLLIGIATVPAFVEVGIGFVTRNTPAENFSFITYREYVGVSSALILFVALIAPDIVCPDRRQRVLSLIFARPLTGRDYALAKIGAIFTCVFAFSYVPQVVLYLGQMFVNEKGTVDYIKHNGPVLWQVPLACLALALFYSVIGIAVASLTGRRIIAAAALLGVTLVTSGVSAAITEANRVRTTQTNLTVEGPDGQTFRTVEVRENEQPAALIDLLSLPLKVRDLIFLGHIGTDDKLSGVKGGGASALGLYLLIVAGSITVVLRRYRSVET